ncbi:helix-turn-helix transcriptional regulator [Halobacillus shinanisalinarum]|uniref:Helix-turn-helix transcriptional regulator n=1 Tax=Halobacillus shinanisalinarum TaxID=2932258 RepID=A0ABY4GU54_9BACI|nr:helix-turn-helix transcriptional regulator [Halobacillus shinanisalinarum]UOQ91690.1 helix-turn-helix transcriptional regulator [Halobacillus shinanisalinarum]
MNIGRRISIYRKRNNMTLQQVAGGKLSTAHLSKIENGYRRPGVHTLHLIAAAFDLSKDFFHHYQDEDEEVNHLLAQLQLFIITDLEKAAPLIEALDENYYEYLSNVHQEIYFLLLKCAYYCKSKMPRDATELYNEYIDAYLHDDKLDTLPVRIQNAYHYCQGIRYYQRSDFQNSLHHYKNFSLLKSPLPVKAALTYNRAVLSNALEDYQMAIDYCKEVRTYYESLNQTEDVSMILNLLGIVYLNQKKYEPAMDYLNEAQAQAEKDENRYLLGQILHNKGVVMRSSGQSEQACVYLERALKLKNLQGVSANKQITFHSLCKAYVERGLLKQALSIYNTASRGISQTSDHYYLLEAFLDYYKQIGDMKSYEQSLAECIDYFEHDADKEPLETLYQKLGHHFYHIGRYKRAADCYRAQIKSTSGHPNNG